MARVGGIGRFPAEDYEKETCFQSYPQPPSPAVRNVKASMAELRVYSLYLQGYDVLLDGETC